MLVDFTVQNFLSIHQPITLSMERINPLIDEKLDDNIVESGYKDIDLLKSIVIYGANASGKSNIIMSLGQMKRLVIDSASKLQRGDKLPYAPFAFADGVQSGPTVMEIKFILDSKLYRYGFEYNQKIFQTEWLFQNKKKLFTRENDKIECSDEFKEGQGLVERTRRNALFLSVCAQLNGKISGRILDGFFSNIEGLDSGSKGYPVFTVNLLDNNEFHDEILMALKAADLGISGVDISESGIKMLHGDKPLPIRYESDGTKKLFGLIGPILDTIDKGYLLLIDELNDHLHPILARNLIKMFHSKTNSKAQLIFSTHDTNMLSSSRFRRDQIWFTEKNQKLETDLYSLADFDDGNLDDQFSFEKDYMRGRYGAIPYLGDFPFAGEES